jgi:hypothetical protein
MVLIGPTLLTPLLILTVRPRLYSQLVLAVCTRGTRNSGSCFGIFGSFLCIFGAVLRGIS